MEDALKLKSKRENVEETIYHSDLSSTALIVSLYGLKSFKVVSVNSPHPVQVRKAVGENPDNIVYGLFIEQQQGLRMIGYIHFKKGKANIRYFQEDLSDKKVAIVEYTELEYGYRGMGLGRALYVAAVNDLLKTHDCVYSDITRSGNAEGVWKSLCRVNPDKIVKRGHSMRVRDDSAPFRYEVVKAPLRRRPVSVRRHQRRG